MAKKKKKPAKKKKKGKSYYMNAPGVELEEQLMAQENIDPQSARARKSMRPEDGEGAKPVEPEL